MRCQYKFFWIFLLCFVSSALFAQRYISGRITDAESGDPVVGAAVFITGTTVGTTTDALGNYQLILPAGEGSYRMGISHVAYQPAFVDIDAGKTSKTLNIALKNYELEEVTVSAKTRFRNKDVDLFWYTILGVKPSKKTMQPLNPEAVYYYYNSKMQNLTVTCRVPLQIINHETGCQIQYVLHHFTHDYKTDFSSWEGQYMFAELEPANYKQKNIWENNRKKTYRSSFTNFIKALYQNSMLENGFLFAYTQKQDNSTQKNPVTVSNLSYYATENAHTHNITNNKQEAKYNLIDSDYLLITDSVSGRKTFYIPPEWDVMLISFGRQVTEKDLEKVKGNKSWETIGLFRNHLITPGDPVLIFPDGSNMNLLQMVPVFSSRSLSGLNMILPTDYRPDGENEVTNALADNAPLMEIQSANPLSDSLAHVAQRFETQLSVFPQEKLYLHTDKPYYLSGERIWFRAHVVDAATHVPEFSSGSVFVELFDARDSVVFRVKTGVANDLFSGYIPIPDDAPEGDYTIRAYTNRMRNLDEDYFFMKSIHIGDPMSRMVHAQPEFEFLSDKKIGAAIRFSPLHPISQTSPASPLSPESLKISINNDKPMDLNSLTIDDIDSSYKYLRKTQILSILTIHLGKLLK